jgi:outer membrane lipoprotein-sorting protein
MKLKLWLLSIALVLPVVSFAEKSDEKAMTIVKERDARDSGWGDQISELKMILRNAQGQESVREMRGKTLEVEGDGDKSLNIFDKPRDVSGAAFLTFSHINEADEQWLYLPALKRVKRISSKNKSGPFMGSEFAYEDLASNEVEKYTYKFIKDDTYEGADTWVIESIPVYENSGYTRLMVWIDKAEYRNLKIDYYDRKNALLKTLTFHDYKKYLDKIWRANRMEMINHQNKKSTSLHWTKLEFNTGLSDSDFNKNSLKRAR